jgi:hypothetical protein
MKLSSVSLLAATFYAAAPAQACITWAVNFQWIEDKPPPNFIYDVYVEENGAEICSGITTALGNGVWTIPCVAGVSSTYTTVLGGTSVLNLSVDGANYSWDVPSGGPYPHTGDDGTC